ncbi:yl-1 protein transcription factor-like [Anaeramoeba flamelloides]|uniref:Yl-1 protein transcription factor-like n=1 Tax=Anaeramoeba flamelloides TaxID=1746091 RepID=A0AAV8AKM7_9EUKA|nr:yl-1 protein transcription factor-like [Anaeramoeba flamelloides]
MSTRTITRNSLELLRHVLEEPNLSQGTLLNQGGFRINLFLSIVIPTTKVKIRKQEKRSKQLELNLNEYLRSFEEIFELEDEQRFDPKRILKKDKSSIQLFKQTINRLCDFLNKSGVIRDQSIVCRVINCYKEEEIIKCQEIFQKKIKYTIDDPFWYLKPNDKSLFPGYNGNSSSIQRSMENQDDFNFGHEFEKEEEKENVKEIKKEKKGKKETRRKKKQKKKKKKTEKEKPQPISKKMDEKTTNTKSNKKKQETQNPKLILSSDPNLDVERLSVSTIPSDHNQFHVDSVKKKPKELNSSKKKERTTRTKRTTRTTRTERDKRREKENVKEITKERAREKRKPKPQKTNKTKSKKIPNGPTNTKTKIKTKKHTSNTMRFVSKKQIKNVKSVLFGKFEDFGFCELNIHPLNPDYESQFVDNVLSRWKKRNKIPIDILERLLIVNAAYGFKYNSRNKFLDVAPELLGPIVSDFESAHQNSIGFARVGGGSWEVEIAAPLTELWREGKLILTKQYLTLTFNEIDCVLLHCKYLKRQQAQIKVLMDKSDMNIMLFSHISDIKPFKIKCVNSYQKRLIMLLWFIFTNQKANKKIIGRNQIIDKINKKLVNTQVIPILPKPNKNILKFLSSWNKIYDPRLDLEGNVKYAKRDYYKDQQVNFLCHLLVQRIVPWQEAFLKIKNNHLTVGTKGKDLKTFKYGSEFKILEEVQDVKMFSIRALINNKNSKTWVFLATSSFERQLIVSTINFFNKQFTKKLIK